MQNNNLLDITPVILHEKKFRDVIKCDISFVTDNLFETVIKKYGVVPFSEYSIIILILECFVNHVEAQRASVKSASKFSFPIELSYGGKKEIQTIYVQAMIDPNGKRVLCFSKLEGEE